MTATALKQKSTVIPMTMGILTLIQHVLLTRDLEINRLSMGALNGTPPAVGWGQATRHAFFQESATLAEQEGLALNEQTYRVIISMERSDPIFAEMGSTHPDDLPARFAFDPWLGQGHGGFVRLTADEAEESASQATPAQAEDALAYRGVMRDWDADAKLHEAEDDPAAAERASDDTIPYDVEIKRVGEQFCLTLSRFGVEVANVGVEIDKGVPTVHVGNAADMDVHLHLAHGGVVITPDTTGKLLEPAPIDRYGYGATESRLAGPEESRTLGDQRLEVFEQLFERYAFGVEIIASGAAHVEDTQQGSLTWAMRVTGEGGADLVFKVRFLEGTNIPCEVYAYNLKDGTEVGHID